MNKKNQNWGIHWFRRDLRIPGNAALKENWRRTQGKTLGFFCFDSVFLSRPDFSHNRFAFFLKTLKKLKSDLTEQGGDLLVVDCQPNEAFAVLLKFLKSNNHKLPSIISWNRDYEPFARQRDASIENLLKTEGLEVFHSRDHLLFEPKEILKNDKSNEFYQIYSPYARKWFEKMNGVEGQSRLINHLNLNDYAAKKNRKPDLFKMNWSEWQKNSGFPFKDSLIEFETANQRSVTIPIPEAGFFEAFQNLKKFKRKIDSYKDNRDFPTLAGTSKLSIFFKNGSLTVTQAIATLGLGRTDWNQKSGAAQFVKELAWREFYYSILYHRPDIENKSFLKQYESIQWENDETFFQRWKEGSTGFPIVDAGMRELATTGWMHNRVRMIVASFLTKDLLIDWRWGENYFMKQLLDGDLAPNNGGWQWASSTGCDPQPYFRIFNPWLQGAKFDPKAAYIKKFVKELEDFPPNIIHDPQADRTRFGYPHPMINHSIQREKAIKLYRQ